MTTADLRARLAAAADLVARSTAPGEWPTVTRLDGAPVPPGYAAWRVGGEGGPVTALPALAPSAPLDVRRRYLARVVANGSGRCPLCSAVAGITPDSPTPDRPAAWHLMPVRVGITHATACPATFTDDDRRHFDPRALGEPS